MLVGAAAQEPPPYLLVAPDASNVLPVHRPSGSTDFVALDTLARFFGLTMREDARTGGVVLAVRGQQVVLTQGQATVSAAGRLVSLSAPVTKEGSSWLVPIDFLRVLGPVLNRPIEIRRASRLVVLDSAAVPRLTPRFERTASGGRLTLTIEPGTTSRITRDGNRITVRFQAAALDVSPLDPAPEGLLTAIRSEGPSLLVDLDPAVINVREGDTQDPTRITLDLIAAAATSPAAPVVPAVPAPAPAINRGNTIRTIAIDPGHGGADTGSQSAAGLLEKEVTLAMARRMKVTIESRLGVRVILTRSADTEVPIDRRGAIANNNKADLFISLHANGSPVAAKRGWQVQSLDPADYGGDAAAAPAATKSESVPVVGGGTRVIDTVIWRLAQLPHASRSLTLAHLVAAHLQNGRLPAQTVPVLQVPLRVLVGANMPAVLIELGFLTNTEDAAELAGEGVQQTVADAVTGVIGELRAGWPAAGGEQ